ncbi:TPA: LOG family protein [Candidatus Geothermarchaeota archaeon]|nr:LOG family protein [Candidatus Geothermarchaeota archaeon]HIQ12996.1 LOG family protein [Thermoprotei archaeon]
MIKICFAAYSGDPKPKDREDIKVFLEKLYKLTDGYREIVFLLGGYWGLMRDIVDVIREKGGQIILFPPLDLEDLEYPHDVIVLKLGLSMRMRSIPMVRSSDIFIALGGEAGSILEIITAYTESKPIYILTGKGYSTDKIGLLSPYIDRRRLTKINIFDDPETLAEEIGRAIKDLVRSSHG